MGKALEMLEGEVELLQMPPRPTLLISKDIPIGDNVNNSSGVSGYSKNATMTISLDGR